MGQLHCIVATPEQAAIDEAADFVALPLADGELGVLPGRSPLIGQLGFGELRVRRGETIRRYYVDGGFVQVLADEVAVLTQRAAPADQLDAAAAQQELERARRLPADTPARMEVRDRETARARARLRVARAAQAARPPRAADGR